jgi:hypothetical protein
MTMVLVAALGIVTWAALLVVVSLALARAAAVGDVVLRRQTMRQVAMEPVRHTDPPARYRRAA